MKIIITVIAALILGGCGGNTEMVLDLRNQQDKWAFYNVGFPSDLRLLDNGRPDLSEFPHRFLSPLVMEAAREAERYEGMTGYAPDTPVYIRFSGAYTQEDFSFPEMPTHFSGADAPIQLIDIDPGSPERGTRYPIDVDFRFERDEYRPASLLEAIPVGPSQRENTTYAFIVTRDIAGEYADELEPGDVLNKLLKGKNPRYADWFISSEAAEEALGVYAPLREQLALDGIDPDDVIAAVVWTTGAPSATAFRLGEVMQDWPLYPLDSDWVKTTDRPEYCVYEATWTVPGFQKGLLPYPSPIFGGDFEYTSDGTPIEQYQRQVTVGVTIPRTPMPAEGYPVMLFHHGTGGWTDNLWNRGKEIPGDDGNIMTTYGSPGHVAAIRGWAGAAMDGHYGRAHQESIALYDWISDLLAGTPMNLFQYNLYNPQGFRDNMFQQLSERILFRRLMSETRIDASDCAGSGEPDAQINTDLVAMMGQSLGAFTMAAQAAVDTHPVQAIIGTGAGTYNMQFAMHVGSGPGGPQVGNILEPLFYFTNVNDIVEDPFHPVYALTRQADAPSDTSLLLAERKRRDAARGDTLNSLMIFGYVDAFVPVPGQKQLIRGLGSDMAGPELDVPSEDSLLLTALKAGRVAYDVPMPGGNGALGETSAFVRYPQDDVMTGHHVFIQHEEPKHQAGCFLQALSAGQTPSVVEGVSEEGIDAPCYGIPALIPNGEPEPF